MIALAPSFDPIGISEAAKISGYSTDWLRDPRCPIKATKRLDNGTRLYDRAEIERVATERAAKRKGGAGKNEEARVGAARLAIVGAVGKAKEPLTGRELRAKAACSSKPSMLGPENRPVGWNRWRSGRGRCRYCRGPLPAAKPGGFTHTVACASQECQAAHLCQTNRAKVKRYRARLRALIVIYDRNCNRCGAHYRGKTRLLCAKCFRHG